MENARAGEEERMGPSYGEAESNWGLPEKAPEP